MEKHPTLDAKRIFVEWSNGTWVNSICPDFIQVLIEETEKHGPPVKFEVRDTWVEETIDSQE